MTNKTSTDTQLLRLDIVFKFQLIASDIHTSI